MSESAVPRGLEPEQVFVRRASGLTRQVGAWDALMFAAVGPGLTVGMVFIMWTAWLYPGMHYPFAIATVAFVIPISALYWFFSVAMPRSGGEYVYVSRVLHPAIGLLCSFIVCITMANAVGLVSGWVVTYGIGDGFAAYGLASGSGWANGIADFLWGNVGKTIAATVVLLFMLYAWLRGTKWVMRTMWAGMVVSLGVIVVLAIVIFANGGQSGFIAKWNAMSGTNYNDILNYASSNGYLVGFTVLATIMGGLTYVCENTTGATFSANIAGEVRGVQKSQMLALFGALVVSMIVWFLGAQLIYSAIGGEFNAALNTILLNAPDKYPAILGGREPFIGLLLGFFTDNVVLLIGVGIAVGFTLWSACVALGFAVHRNIFAWSFDRIIPAKFAELDRRYRQPWLTVISFTIASELFLVGYIWTPQYLGFVSFFIFLWFLGWILLGIAGILFPYRQRLIYENASPLVRSRFLGAPVVSIMGVVTLAISIAVEIFMLVPIVQGTIDWRTLITVGIFIVLPFIIFYVSKAYRSKSAVPLELQFKEIPPE